MRKRSRMGRSYLFAVLSGIIVAASYFVQDIRAKEPGAMLASAALRCAPRQWAADYAPALLPTFNTDEDARAVRDILKRAEPKPAPATPKAPVVVATAVPEKPSAHRYTLSQLQAMTDNMAAMARKFDQKQESPRQVALAPTVLANYEVVEHNTPVLVFLIKDSHGVKMERYEIVVQGPNIDAQFCQATERVRLLLKKTTLRIETTQ
jgi:hypothetical protein